MRTLPLAAALLVWGCGAGLEAGALKGRLAPSSKADLEEYVVWIEEGASLPALEASGKPQAMNQIDKDFSPRTLAVRAGDKVLFENLDNVFHNVFSLDKRNPFDLGLFKGKKRFNEDKRTKHSETGAPLQPFPKEGKYAVYCNIHPDMVGTVHVFGHGYYARSDKDGIFSLPAPDQGKVTVRVDGPRLADPVRLTVDLAKPPAPLELALKLRRLGHQAPHLKKDGRSYTDY